MENSQHESDELSAREGHVLAGLVEEYIRSAHPVGSEQLVKTMRLDMSPATVRNILRFLEEEDYVLQPHTSAGRVPTDLGYRYYVDHQSAGRISQKQLRQLAILLEAYQRQYHSRAQAVARALAEASGGLAAAGWLRDHDIHQAGLRGLAQQVPNAPAESIQEVLEMFDDLDSVVEHFSEIDDPQPRVYIGRENPVMPAQHTSVVAHHIRTPDQDIVLMLVGPKHMPYRQNVAWLNSLAGMFDDLGL